MDSSERNRDGSGGLRPPQTTGGGPDFELNASESWSDEWGSATPVLPLPVQNETAVRFQEW